MLINDTIYVSVHIGTVVTVLIIVDKHCAKHDKSELGRRRNTFILLSEHSWEGTWPVKELLNIASEVSKDRLPIVVGIFPVRLFNPIDRNDNAVICPRAVGIDPVRELDKRLK